MHPRNQTNHPNPRKQRPPGDEELTHPPKWEVLVGPVLEDKNGEQTDTLRDPLWVDQSVPETPLQALMEAAPHQEPVRSREEMATVSELIEDVLDELPPEDRQLLDAVVRGQSFRTQALEVGDPNHVATYRRWQELRSRLRILLVDVAPDGWTDA